MQAAKSTPGRPWIAGALAASMLAVGAAPARADAQTHPVRIDSDPPGATISLGNGDQIGKTPFEGSLPPGVHTLIFERTGYETGVEVIEVRDDREPQSLTIELVEARYGAVEVLAGDGGATLEGAEIWVDGEKLGDAPGSLQIPVGPHHIEVIKSGYEVYEVWVEVAEGETAEVVARLAIDPDAEIVAAQVEPTVRAAPLVTLGGGLEFGGRTFRYDNPQTPNLRSYNAAAVPLLRMTVALYPLSRTDNEWLTGLSLVGKGAWALPLDSSTEDGQVLSTSWSEYDVAARALLPVVDDVRGGFEAGHGRARFEFRDAGELADAVPDVDYRYARVGAITSAPVGRYDVSGAASYVRPYETGRTAERFAEANVWGMALAASIGSRFASHVDASVTAHYTRYAYSLTAAPDDTHRADGGVDHFFGLSLNGYVRY